MVFGQNLKISVFAKKMIPLERAPQEEQNDANFSSIAHSSEEVLVLKEIQSKPWTLVCYISGSPLIW